MSGVRTGSRLEQLRALHARIGHEIAALEREQALAPRHRPNTVDRLLDELGVTATQVKRWALDAGLITEIKRGRVGLQLVEAYMAAQPPAVV